MAEDKILIKRSGVSGDIPLAAQLELGELAINYADSRLFAKNSLGEVVDLSGLPPSNNTIYVSVEGNDAYSGREPGEAKRTIRAALNAIGPGNTVSIGAGTFVEETPLIMPQRTTIHGVDQRVTTVRPNTATNDIFWVSTGCYIAGLAFRGHMKPAFSVSFPGVLHSGTAGPGSTASTFVLDSTKAVTGISLDDYYREMRITLTGGTGSGQSRNIVTYSTATKTATIDSNWSTIPDTSTTYYIDISIPAAPSPTTRYSTYITASPYLYNMASITSDELLSVSTTTNAIDDGITRPLITGSGGGAPQDFVIASGLTNIVTGRWVRIVYDAQNYMTGTIVSYNSSTGALRVNIIKSVRNSQVTRNSWQIYYICGSGMEIDGYKSAGLRSMVSAQFTQFNSGGDAVVIRNMGYAQLVSIYAICCEDGFLAESGGTASMGNCNVNFGTFGLVAQDVGPLLMTGRTGFIYDKERCERDTKLIVDGIVQDLLNEGVNQATFSGIQYWNQDSVVATSTDLLTVGTGSKSLSVQTGLSSDVIANGDYVRLVYDELNYMYGKITSYNTGTGALNVNVTRAKGAGANTGWEVFGPGTNRVPDNANPLLSQKNATASAIEELGEQIKTVVTTASEETFLDNACNKIADIIRYGTSDLTWQIVRNSVSISTAPNAVAANTAVYSNKTTIVDNVISYLTSNFPSLSYSQDKCRRDLGFIIDCICFDMMYNIDPTYAAPSNRQTIQAGVYYYGYTTQSALGDEKPQTVSAFNYLKSEIAAVLPTAANAHIRTLANSKIDVINDLITYGPTGETQFTGTIASDTLTVTAVSANSIRVGMTFTANANGSIVSQLTGDRGSTGTYKLTIPQTVGTSTIFKADYTSPITFTRNTASVLVDAGNKLNADRTSISSNVTNYIDTITFNGYPGQIGYFINVSNIVANTDARFAISKDTKPYLGLVMYVEGETTIDIQPGPGYEIGETIRIKDRSAPTTNYMNATVTAFDLVTGAMTVTVTGSLGSGTYQFWDVERLGTPSYPKKGRFTQEITIVNTGSLSINSVDTSKEINKYRTIVAANTVGDITYLELDERVPNNITLGATTYTGGLPKNAKVFFYQKSALSASGQTFEFVGSGTSVAVALPRNGGDIVQANEVVSSNGGIVYFTSTDQFGNFRIGEDLTINFNTGTLSGRTFTRSLFAQITPFVLALDS